MRIFVSNLAFQVTAEDLRSVFIAYHKVESIFIINDRATGKSKGFGYVDITPDSEAKAAIEELNGKLLMDRPLILKVALPPGETKGKEPRTPQKLGAKRFGPKGGKAGMSGGKPAVKRDDSEKSPWTKSGTGKKSQYGRENQGGSGGRPPRSTGAPGGKSQGKKNSPGSGQRH